MVLEWYASKSPQSGVQRGMLVVYDRVFVRIDYQQWLTFGKHRRGERGQVVAMARPVLGDTDTASDARPIAIEDCEHGAGCANNSRGEPGEALEGFIMHPIKASTGY
jgi:hypothetical protein